MPTTKHDRRAASAVTVRPLPLLALLAIAGCTTTAAAVPVATEFDGHADGFEASDGWVNGEQNGCGWRRQNASIEDGTLTLKIDDRRSRGRDYSCGEYRTTEHYGFGYYETRARVQPADGTVTAFFTYTGEPFGDPHDEIDFEWLGRDTTEVQVNYFVDGRGRHERMIDLGFDAAADFHIYGFEWRRDAVRWYVDCKLVHEVTRADGPLPRAPGRMYVHLWNGTDSVNDWLGEFDYQGQPVRSTFDYIRHVPGGTHEEGSSCANGRPLQAAAAEPAIETAEPEAPAKAGPMIPRQKPQMVEMPETEAAAGEGAASGEPVEELDPAATAIDSGEELSQAAVGDRSPVLDQATPAAKDPSTPPPASETSATVSNDGQPIPLGAFGAAPQ